MVDFRNTFNASNPLESSQLLLYFKTTYKLPAALEDTQKFELK